MEDQKLLALHKKALSLAARLQNQRARALIAIHKTSVSTSPKTSYAKTFMAGFNLASAYSSPARGPAASIRPTTPAGLQSFHFAIAGISRASELTAKINSANKRLSSTATSIAAAHQKYIERDAALEIQPDLEQPSEKIISAAAERPASPPAKMIGPSDEGYTAAAADYIDRASATDASFGTIAPTLDERIAYWLAVEQAERRPLTNPVRLTRRAEPEFWAHVLADAQAPDILKDAVAGSDDDIFIPKITTANGLALNAYYEAFQKTRPPDQSTEAKAVTIQPGRGGRIQTRLVAELPADMTASQRLEIARRFCKTEFEDRGAPYHCAIHAPTEKNHDKNFHLHVTAHDRPAKRVPHPVTGQQIWDFEYIEEYRDSKRTARNRRPLMQEKIRATSTHATGQRRLAQASPKSSTRSGPSPAWRLCTIPNPTRIWGSQSNRFLLSHEANTSIS